MIPLEDSFSDVIGKAQRGLALTDEQLAQAARISVEALNRVKGGEFDEGAVRKLAPGLKLGAAALVALGMKAWYPQSTGHVDGLAMFNTTFEDMTVNSYLVWDPETRRAVTFDTGTDCSGMLKLAEEKKLKIELILLTHTHPDHIADLAKLKAASGAPAWVCGLEAIDGATSFAAGKTFAVGELKIETRQTSGHSPGGITFVISGLSRRVAIAGDSIFASSMGGGKISYADALRNNREQILTLPDNTIICPGHGPMTTVGEEKANNPFFT